MATYNNIKKIKIGDNIFNLYDSGNSGGTITSVKTTAGAHTAVNVTSGAVSFNVPTKTSHLTNDSGFLTSHQTITKAMVTTALGTGSGTTKFLREDGSWATPAYIANTDAKLQVAEVTSATQYYPLVGTGTTAATRQYDTTGFKYKGTTGTTSAVGSATVELGNSTASGTAGNKQAQLIMYGSNAKKATITLAAPSADIALALPTSGGTLALTSQIPTTLPASDVYSWAKASTKPTYTASEVGALASNTTYVSKITTTAGAHTAISNKSGAVSFNVPTKTSHLTNDSGFITSYTDTQVTSTAVTAATTLYLTGSTSTTTTGTLDKHASARISVSDSSTNNGYTRLILGNSTSNSAVGGKSGSIRLYSVTSYYSTIHSEMIQSNCDITLPGSTGTLALTSDIPTSATEIGAVPTTRTVNGKALSADVADADYVIEEGTSGVWNYRKWHSGKVEAWTTKDFASTSWTTWASPVRYMDKTLTFPSGLFPSNSTPALIATSCSNQYWVVGCTVTSATQATLRIASVSSTAMQTTIRFYAHNV